MDVSLIVQRFLSEAQEDYVGLWQIFNSVSNGTNPAKARELTLEIVSQLLAAGLRPGQSPYKPGGFQPWPEQEEEKIIHRIVEEWDASGQAPNLLDVWFSLETRR